VVLSSFLSMIILHYYIIVYSSAPAIGNNINIIKGISKVVDTVLTGPSLICGRV
jgi:hypothetical protein